MNFVLTAALAKGALRAAEAAVTAGKVVRTGRRAQRKVEAVLHPFQHPQAPARTEKKEEITMKKSTLVAVVAFLSAIAGALAALFLYLRRREKELDEYEALLFSEEFNDEPEEARAVAHDEDEPAPSANCMDAM